MADIQRGGINAGMITNTNVSYTKPTSGQVLKYNSTTDLWEPGTDASSTDATQLQGVDICTTTPTDGQVLTYDLASTEWCPADAGGGGGKIVQVVTVLTEVSYAFPDSTWRSTGFSLAITPTSATNKILGFAGIPCEGVGGFVIGQLDWYRLDTAMSSGDTLSGGTRLYESTDSNGKYVDWRTGGSYTPIQVQPVINCDFTDDSYSTTDEIFYNLVGNVPSDDFNTRGIPFTLILMEVDES
tara:strand:+ start:1768 stop:2490 length:723 start_codon:yes stop_codon:yes gene_type:complete